MTGVRSFDEIAPVLAELERFRHPWHVCGGWAIDLFLDDVTREHEDVEIGVFRRDQQALRAHYAGWGHFKVERAGHWDEWRGERLELPIHQLLFRPPGAGPPPNPWEPERQERQFLLDDAEGGVWISRRDRRLRRPLAEVTVRSKSGVPIVAPEIQLLYKAKHTGDKDEHDFRLTLPRLDAAQRAWLSDALRLVHPGHRWLGALG